MNFIKNLIFLLLFTSLYFKAKAQLEVSFNFALGGRHTSSLKNNKSSTKQPNIENLGIDAILIGYSHDDHIRRYDF